MRAGGAAAVSHLARRPSVRDFCQPHGHFPALVRFALGGKRLQASAVRQVRYSLHYAAIRSALYRLHHHAWMCIRMGSGWKEVTNCRFITAEPRLANTPLSNGDAVRGKIALVHRDPENTKQGRTSFVQKALYAQQAGAIAAVVVNYKNDVLRPADVARGHDGPVGLGNTVTIPVIAVPHRIGVCVCLRISLCASLRNLLSLSACLSVCLSA